MIDHIARLREKMNTALIEDKATLERFRQDFIGKKGCIAHLFETFKQLPIAAKKAIGPALNGLKNEAEKKFKSAASALEAVPPPAMQQPVDVTLPAFGAAIGSLHPLTIVQNKIISIFQRMGFNLAEGSEIVGDWHNFGALNFPENHPARDLQDTFFCNLIQLSCCVPTPLLYRLKPVQPKALLFDLLRWGVCLEMKPFLHDRIVFSSNRWHVCTHRCHL